MTKYISDPLIVRERRGTKQGYIEVVAWKVPKTKHYPEGIKYSFVYIKNKKRVIGFDNYNNEGHHVHYFDEKKAFAFVTTDKTIDLLKKLVEELEDEN